MTEKYPQEQVSLETLYWECSALKSSIERAEWLNRRCHNDPALRAKLERMLASEDDADRFAEALFPMVDLKNDNGHPHGEIIGPYKLLQEIGRGGMGVVYMAEQSHPFERRVALKVIKPGMDTRQVIARFEAERQALAMMDHPHIAKVLDAGTTGTGRPFFVMELVKGVPITQYCDEKRLGLRERLELFLPVCQAIQHAHQKGIIHRDVKPSNVLVALYDGRPVPKVIDFGVAKATSHKLTQKTMFTEFGQVIGTLEYMSPEQAVLNQLDIDTRTDIYSLGVLLYELLTGSTPLDRQRLRTAAFDEMLRIIREEEPPKPSTRLSTSQTAATTAANRATEPARLSKMVRGELDWIVMKTLAKDRDRRYETANELGSDIERFLTHEPVSAGPPTMVYRVRSFAKRHRAKTLAGALVLLALVVGMIGLAVGLIEARHQTSLARSEAKAKDRARMEAEAARKKAIEFRDKALDALRATTGMSVLNLIGEKKELSSSERTYLEAIAGRWQTFASLEETDEQSRAVRAEGHFRVAFLWDQLGRREDARSQYEQALAIREKLATEFPAVAVYRYDLAQSLDCLGNLLSEAGKYPEAEHAYRQALTIREKLAVDFPTMPEYRAELAASHQFLGQLLQKRGKHAEAERMFLQCKAITKELAAEFPAVPSYRDQLAWSHNSLGHLLSDLGRSGDAENEYRQALTIREKLAAEFPNRPHCRALLASSHNNLGLLLDGSLKDAEAEQEYRQALTIREELASEFPSMPEYRKDLAKSHNNLGMVLKELSRHSEGEQYARQALAIREKLADEFPETPAERNDRAGSHVNLGVLLKELGKDREAEQEYRRALAIQEALATEFPAERTFRRALAIGHHNLGGVLTVLLKHAEAEQEYRQALAIWKKLADEFSIVPAYRNELAGGHNDLGTMLLKQGKHAEAEQEFRQALAIREQLAAEFPTVLDYRVNLGASYCNFGSLLRQGGRSLESVPWYKNAIDTLEPLYRAEPGHVTARMLLGNSHVGRAAAFHDLEKHAEEERDWERAIELNPHQERGQIGYMRAMAQLEAGRVDEAVAQLADLGQTTANEWYILACVCSVASGKAVNRKREYADRAIEMLQKAIQAGWKDAAYIMRDTDLDPVRGRDDFEQLVESLESSMPDAASTRSMMFGR